MVVLISPNLVLVTPTQLLTFSPPELPGGVAATGTAFGEDGKVYAISVDSVGSGYTKAPSVTIGGDGSNAKAK